MALKKTFLKRSCPMALSNSKRVGRRRLSKLAVGEDIRCPAQIAKNGVIRIRSERAAQVARWFGLDARRADSDMTGSARRAKTDSRRKTTDAPRAKTDAKAASDSRATLDVPARLLRPGTITLIAGPSGAGKSTLLHATRDAHRQRRWIDLATLPAPDAPLVDCFGDLPLRDALGLLARVGLGEAWTYLRTPGELSEGQRWRFRLALALHELSSSVTATSTAAMPAGPADHSPILACDEFAAVLDRVTAVIVAHRLRRAIDALPHAAAVVATSHEDIEPALAAEVIVRCDFGRIEEEKCEHESTRMDTHLHESQRD
jgi:ABC-type glutathione transport system ATPase component